MRRIWMGVIPRLDETKVVVQGSWEETLLRARLPPSPGHPRALATLCRAISLWCDRKVCVALVVEGPDTFFATRPWLPTRDALEACADQRRFEVHLARLGGSTPEPDLLDPIYDYDSLRRRILLGDVR